MTFGLEHLEARCLLAGNVTVQTVDGQLVVIGDGLANNVTVLGPVDNPFQSGLHFVGNKRTTINGQGDIYIDFAPLVIALGAGDDRIAIEYFDNDTSMRIDLGEGSDRVSLHSVDARAADVFGGDGSDDIALRDASFTRRLRIFPGAGADVVGLNGVHVLRGFDIADAGAASVVNLSGVTARASSVISTGNRGDRISITESVLHALNIYTRGGDDNILIRNDTFDTPSIVYGGTGENALHRRNVMGVIDRRGI